MLQSCQPRQPHNIQGLKELRADLIHPRGPATEELTKQRIGIQWWRSFCDVKVPFRIHFDVTTNGHLRRRADSFIFVDDEGIDMDSISCSSGSRQTNMGPVDQASRLSTWVTFDDDGKATQLPVPPTERPSCIRLDNVLPPPHGLQNGDSNHATTRAWNQNRGQNGGPEHHLLDLTPDSSSNGGFHSSVDSSVSYAEKNPFFNEAFDDVKPSTINPFSSFFDGGQKMEEWSQADGRHMDLGSDLLSPVHQSQNTQTIFFGESGGGGDVFHDGPLTNKLDELEHLRSLQIYDPHHAGSPGHLDYDDEGVEEGEEVQEHPAGDDPYLPSHMVAQEGWPMLLRIPEKKNIMSSRHWGPIYVRLSDDGFLRLFYERGLDKPFRSLRLQPQHEVSEHRLQSYEDTGRVHTLSVELLQYREKRRIQPKSPVTHQPVREQLVKLATPCYHDYLSFRHALGQRLRRLHHSDGAPPGSLAPVTAPTAGVLQLSEEEVQVEVRDEFYGTVAEGDGRILKQLVVTRVAVLAFLSGLPRCQLGLNDVQVKGKELVSRHDIVPTSTTRWIRLYDLELHEEHADELQFLTTRAVVFTPPQRCRFELLRFRTPFTERTLPFTLRTVASVKGAEVTVQSWLLMSQGFTSNRDTFNLIPCENVAIRYPIPEIWAKNFRRDGVIGEKSLKARFNKGASFGTASASGAEPAMRVTLGAAKYEQAFKSVVWRIPRLPDKNSALGHPHTFFCRLELGSDQEVPRALERQLEVEFDMPAAAASKVTVRSLSVDDRTDVKKWINYKSHFFYQVPIEHKREDITDMGNVPADRPGECAHQ
ncbi:Stonin-2 [Merluccius polli]|uniref:Stonin-2 n=1 Tax=Merluccius polli TaxID=89951 RepID=A0AA47N5L4_MERPO|nr:Stonin-2 [Merluccius polli]